MNKNVLVTGASAGIGQATAIRLAQQGYAVYGAARRVENMQQLRSYGIKPIALDVTQEESIVACINQILAEAGSIDVLVNNAGFGSYGAIEDVTMADARYQLEVNVLGAMRLTQLVLPTMRENGYGKIVNVSSIGGKIAFPLGGWYHASKFALEALSDSLRNEVREFGIDVIVIEPGAIKSEWSGIAFDSLQKVSGDTAYKALATKVYNSFTKISGSASEPLVVAETIVKALASKKPKTRYAAGNMASSLLLMAKLLPNKLMDKVIASQFN